MLDFVSITGHVHWPDMPEPDSEIQYIIDFHRMGFAKLKQGWNRMMDTLRANNREGTFVIFPGFEVHFNVPVIETSSQRTGRRNPLPYRLDGSSQTVAASAT